MVSMSSFVSKRLLKSSHVSVLYVCCFWLTSSERPMHLAAATPDVAASPLPFPKNRLCVCYSLYNLSGNAMRDRHIHCQGANSHVTPGVACRHLTCDAVASRETRDRLPSLLRPYQASAALQRAWGRDRSLRCEGLSYMCISSPSSNLD